jgi:hypothetical protein
MNNKIDFMGIGAARAGSTWLWSILNQHPEIWMPPIKELHYFDRSMDYPSPSVLADDRFIDRLFGREKHNAAFRVLSIRHIGSTLLTPQKWGDLRWKLRYFLGTYNDNWYLSLFDNKKKATKGEVSPAYSILSSDDIQHIHTLFPDLKVIYLIRNPVDRTWSGLRYRWSKRRLDINNLDEVIRTIDSPSQAYRSNYIRTIQNWSSCFPRKQFLICFYDDIVKQPQQLITNVLTFLNIDPSIPIPMNELHARVNASKEKRMPEAIEHYLAQKYYPEVKKLIPLVGGYSEEWLKEIEAYL